MHFTLKVRPFDDPHDILPGPGRLMARLDGPVELRPLSGVEIGLPFDVSDLNKSLKRSCILLPLDHWLFVPPFQNELNPFTVSGPEL